MANIRCINCNSAITPKNIEIGLHFICANIKQGKGKVKANYGCKAGEKRWKNLANTKLN